MSSAEIFTHLLTWTPFLLGGFAWNILIALSATLLGTSVGAWLAWLREGNSKRAADLSMATSTMFFRLPTVALLFYAAVLLPNEVQVPWTDTIYPFPTWIKAAVALSAAQVGFTSNNLAASIRLWRKREHGAALLFIPNWGSHLLITIIASSSASLVGVSELVSRCNKVINASDNTELMFPIYLYASLIFLGFCFPLTMAMKKLKHAMFLRLVVSNQDEQELAPDTGEEE